MSKPTLCRRCPADRCPINRFLPGFHSSTAATRAPRGLRASVAAVCYSGVIATRRGHLRTGLYVSLVAAVTVLMVLAR